MTARRLIYISAALTATSLVAAVYVSFEIRRAVRDIFNP